jgi:predicted transglutaminase-like cysteine proteinase
MRRSLLILFACLSFTSARAETLNHDFSAFTHWRYVLKHEHVKPSAPFSGDLKPALDDIHAKYAQVPYKHSLDVYGDANHWSTRTETRKHGAADCKGIAEAEMFDLLEMGVPDQDVKIVVAYINQTGAVHAVTQVKDWVLDIRAKRVMTADEFRQHYLPVYSINRLGWKMENSSVASDE